MGGVRVLIHTGRRRNPTPALHQNTARAATLDSGTCAGGGQSSVSVASSSEVAGRAYTALSPA